MQKETYVRNKRVKETQKPHIGNKTHANYRINLIFIVLLGIYAPMTKKKLLKQTLHRIIMTNTTILHKACHSPRESVTNILLSTIQLNIIANLRI